MTEIRNVTSLPGKGQKFETFYGNGQSCGIITVSKATDKSIFVTDQTGHEHREGNKSVLRYISNGLWKEIFN